MNPTAVNVNSWSEPGVRRYAAVGLATLGVIGVVLLPRAGLTLALVPVLAGLGGGLTRIGPVLLVLAVVVTLNAPPFFPVTSPRPLLDGLLCAAVLGYVAAHYRLQSILLDAFPPDPRRRAAPAPRTGRFRLGSFRPPVVRQRRPAAWVTPSEAASLVYALPAWAALGWLVLRAASGGGNPGLLPAVWQAIRLAWLLGSAWLITAAALAYYRDRCRPPDEAALFLQDELWAETRREQRRLNRWLVWQRRRSGPKERS
jgi:hypothetical protein